MIFQRVLKSLTLKSKRSKTVNNMEQTTTGRTKEEVIWIILLGIGVLQITKAKESTEWWTRPITKDEVRKIDQLEIDIIGEARNEIVRIRNRIMSKENITILQDRLEAGTRLVKEESISKLKAIKQTVTKFKQRFGRIWIEGKEGS